MPGRTDATLERAIARPTRAPRVCESASTASTNGQLYKARQNSPIWTQTHKRTCAHARGTRLN
jgi:hypothetical protein